jgi:hypothetical protein
MKTRTSRLDDHKVCRLQYRDEIECIPFTELKLKLTNWQDERQRVLRL